MPHVRLICVTTLLLALLLVADSIADDLVIRPDCQSRVGGMIKALFQVKADSSVVSVLTLNDDSTTGHSFDIKTGAVAREYSSKRRFRHIAVANNHGVATTFDDEIMTLTFDPEWTESVLKRSGRFDAVATDHAGKFALFGKDNGAIEKMRFKVEEWSTFGSFPQHSAISSIVISDDDKLVAVGNDRGELRILSSEGHEQCDVIAERDDGSVLANGIATIAIRSDPANPIAWSRWDEDFRFRFPNCRDRTVTVRTQHRLSKACVFLGNSDKIALADRNEVLVVSMTSGKKCLQLEGAKGFISTLCWTEASQCLVAGTWKGEVVAWKLGSALNKNLNGD